MMLKRRISIIVFLLLAGIGLHAQSGGKGRPEFLTPREIYLLIENSKTVYSMRIIPVDSMKQGALDVMFPQVTDRLPFPMVESNNGEFSATTYAFDSLEYEMMARAEADYQAGRYEQARDIYMKVIKDWPRCYPALSHIGDSYLFSGDFATALRYYDSAIGLNPYDPQLYYYRGNALIRMKQLDNAIDSYIDALALLPHYPAVMSVLNSVAKSGGLELHDGLFNPKTCARLDDAGVSVELTEETTSNGWMMYGISKGMWLGEPEHRKKVLGDDRHHWSSVEEQECLLATMESYLTLKKDNDEISAPDLDKLFEISTDGHLLSFILYEIGYRMDPHIMLRTNDAVRKQVREYISRYVVVREDS